MNVLIVPDSFKGTMSSETVCKCIESGIKSANADVSIISLPFADGGEGFANCYKNYSNGEKIEKKCHDIYGNIIDGYFYKCGDFAVIESATASGIQQKKDIMNASSFGTGELIDFAYSLGLKNIILGLGGSGMCDGGIGALSAMQFKFFDKENKEIKELFGKNLLKINSYKKFKKYDNLNITFASDVTNEYYGKNGAAYIFAPQKGATKEEVLILDAGLQNVAKVLNIPNEKSFGAAGGLSGALKSQFGGSIESGFNILKEISNLEEKIKWADLVITGEGKTDYQTLMGKLPQKIFELTEKYGKDLCLISGSIEGASLGKNMISLVDEKTTLEDAIKNPEKVLKEKSKLLLI